MRNEETIEFCTSNGAAIDFSTFKSEDSCSNLKINCQVGAIFIDLINQGAMLNNHFFASSVTQ